MTITCTFALNNQPLSELVCPGVGNLSAFSGRGEGRNNPDAADKPMIGPLPPGLYYIVDRQAGGTMGWARDFVAKHFSSTDRSTWFALYRDDGSIDDDTTIKDIHRGAFRLHPKGPLGLSEGCITVVHQSDFDRLAAALRAVSSPPKINGTTYYGMVVVA